MAQEIYDIIIIGGGPAGAAAAVYAARKKLKTLVITEDFGGQSVVSAGIQNWIGEENITGLDLAKKLEKHVRVQEGIEVKSPERVTEAKEGADCIFEITTDKGETYRSKTLMIGSGARRRRLNLTVA
jgi:alkyl hydroperoxide reductase subunit F